MNGNASGLNLSNLRLYWREFMKTILQIIEDQPHNQVSDKMYVMLIAWHFVQIAGYLYSDEKRLIENEYNSVVQKVEYISTFTYLMYFKENDSLTTAVWGIMFSFMVFYYVYLILLTYKRLFDQDWIQQYQESLTSINRKLNVFFVLYQWVFFIPFFEINIGTMICGPQCFFPSHREEHITSCSIHPAQVILSSIGLVLALITSTIIIIFYRNYEFNEQNLLKRRYSHILLFQFALYFVIVFFTFANTISLTLKYLCLQAIVLTLLYDLFWNIPFRNPTVIKAYSIASIFFEATCIVYTYLILYPSESDEEMIYQVLIFGALASTLLITFWSYKYHSIIKMKTDSFQKKYKFIDFYLEEIFRLNQLAQSDQISRYILQEVFISHRDSCVNLECSCHTFGKKTLTNDNILNLIQSVFQTILNSKEVQKDSFEREHLSLKYISFVGKYLNNSTQAYYQLKKLITVSKSQSFYFKAIGELLSRRIEHMMSERIQREAIGYEDSSRSLRKSLQEFQQQDLSRETLIPLLASFIEKKISFWKYVKDPNISLNQLLKRVLDLSANSQQLTEEVIKQFGSLTLLTKTSQNAVVLKIVSIFKCLVQLQLTQSRILEQNTIDLVKKDYGKSQELLTNINVIQGNVVCALVSLIQDRGKILNASKNQLLGFFGFQLDESKELVYIEQLMPSFISTAHNGLMFNFIRRGYSVVFNRGHYTFAQNKQGFLVPIKIQFDFSTQFSDDFVLNCCILRLQTPVQHILLDSKGIIRGITQRLYELLFSELSNAKAFTTFQTLGIKSKDKPFQFASFLSSLHLMFISPLLLQTIQKRKAEPKKISEDRDPTVDVEGSLINQEKAVLIVPKMLQTLVNDFYAKNPQHRTLMATNYEINEMDPSLSQSFKAFYFQNKVHWEYFKSKQIQIIFNVQEKSLAYQEEGAISGEKKDYYVIEVTDAAQIIKTTKTEFFNDETYSKSGVLLKSSVNLFGSAEGMVSQQQITLPQSTRSIVNRPNKDRRLSTSIMQNNPNLAASLNLQDGIDKIIRLSKPSSIDRSIALQSMPKSPSSSSPAQKQNDNVLDKVLTFQMGQFQNIESPRSSIVAFNDDNNLSPHWKTDSSVGFENAKYNKSKFGEAKQPIQQNQQQSKSAPVTRKDVDFQTNNTQTAQQTQQKATDNQKNNLIGEMIEQESKSLPSSPSEDSSYYSTQNAENIPEENADHQQYIDKLIHRNNIHTLKLEVMHDEMPVNELYEVVSSHHQIHTTEGTNVFSPTKMTQGQESERHLIEENKWKIGDGGIIEVEGEESVYLDQTKKRKKTERRVTVTERSRTVIKQQLNSVFFWKRVSDRPGSDVKSEESYEGRKRAITNIRSSNNITKGRRSYESASSSELGVIKLQRTSLNSHSTHSRIQDNQIIQNVLLTKKPVIIRPLRMLITGRFLIFFSLITIILISSLIQISQLEKSLDKSLEIGNILKLCAEVNYITLKIFQIQVGVLNNSISSQELIQMEQMLSTVTEQYAQQQQSSFELILEIGQQMEYSQINEISFSYKDAKQSKVNLIEFFFYTTNAILQVKDNPSNQYKFGLYYLHSNFETYSQVLNQINDQYNAKYYNYKDSLELQYFILGLAVISFLAFLFVIANFYLRNIAAYKKKILQLLTRITPNGIDKEILILETCKEQLRDANFSWQQVDFSAFISDNVFHSVKFTQLEKKIPKQYEQTQQQLLSPAKIDNNPNDKQLKSHLTQGPVSLEGDEKMKNSLSETNKNNQQNLSSPVSSTAPHGLSVKTPILSNPSENKTKSAKNKLISSKKQKINQTNNNNNSYININNTQKGQQNISIKLQGQQLHTRSFHIFIMSALQLSGLFTLGMLLLSYFQTQNLTTCLSVLKDTSSFYQAFNVGLVLSEFLVNDILVNTFDTSYPIHGSQEISDSLNTAQSKINSFMVEIMVDLSTLSDSVDNSFDLIRQLYSNDICDQFSESSFCTQAAQISLSPMQERFRLTLNQGISGILSVYLAFFKTVQQIFKTTQSPSVQQQLATDYINSESEYLYYFEAYNLPVQATEMLFNTTVSFNKNQSQNIFSQTLISYAIFGILIIVLQFCIDLWIRSNLNRQIKRINLALTFIPPVIAQEESTNQILKSIFSHF